MKYISTFQSFSQNYAIVPAFLLRTGEYLSRNIAFFFLFYYFFYIFLQNWAQTVVAFNFTTNSLIMMTTKYQVLLLSHPFHQKPNISSQSSQFQRLTQQCSHLQLFQKHRQHFGLLLSQTGVHCKLQKLILVGLNYLYTSSYPFNPGRNRFLKIMLKQQFQFFMYKITFTKEPMNFFINIMWMIFS